MGLLKPKAIVKTEKKLDLKQSNVDLSQRHLLQLLRNCTIICVNRDKETLHPYDFN